MIMRRWNIAACGSVLRSLFPLACLPILLAALPDRPQTTATLSGSSTSNWVRVIWIFPEFNDAASPEPPRLSIDDHVVPEEGRLIDLEGELGKAWLWKLPRAELVTNASDIPHELILGKEENQLRAVIPAGELPEEICIGGPEEARGIEDQPLRPRTATSSLEVSATVFPNPFNPLNGLNGDTRIQWVQPEAQAEVTIKVYDWNGEYVATPFRGSGTEGVNEVFWGGQTEDGRNLGNGVYFIRIVSDNGARQKSALLKVVIWNEN